MKNTKNKKTLHTIIKVILYIIVLIVSLIAFSMANKTTTVADSLQEEITEDILL